MVKSMRKEFSMSNDKILINFTAKYCKTFESLLESEGFRRVLDVYLKKAQKKHSRSFRYLEETLGESDIASIRNDLARVFKYLTVMSVDEVVENNPKYKEFLSNKDDAIVVIEELYLFWRKLERYTIIHGGVLDSGLAAMSFTEANAGFSSLVLNLYRKVEKSILDVTPRVFRQIPAGGNASIMISKVNWPKPKGYEILENIPFIDAIMLETPFITYPKRNT